MMPSITFSRPCRSTLNGICAAFGKLGALLGATLFVPLATWLGNDHVMIACAAVSVLAATMTMFFIDTTDAGTESEIGTKITQVSSEAHLASLMQEPSAVHDADNTETQAPKLHKVGSIPTFLDIQ